jgi:adenylate cyclase
MKLFLKKLSRRQYHRLLHTIIVLGVGCLFTLLVLVVQPFTRINLSLTDQLFAPEPPSSNIVIVGIDDATLETYGKWSEWHRSLHAQAINNLSAAGAKVIGFDVLFADTSTDDTILSQAIKEAGNVVLAAVGVEPLPSSQSSLTYEHFLFPTALLKQASHSIGHANIAPDTDGVVRRLPLVIVNSSGQILPALSVAMLQVMFPESFSNDYQLHNNKLHLIGRDIPVDQYKMLRINYVTPDISYSYLSYVNVIKGDFDPSIVKHKLVIIGMTATGEIDTWATPVSAEKQPGVWIHANVMDNILRQRFVVDTDWHITLMLMLLFVVITGFALPRLKLKWGAVLVVALIIGYMISVFITFDRGYILNLLYPSMLMPVAYIAIVLCVVVSEQSHKQLIKDLFGRYVSPQVATKILELDDIGKLELGGELRTVSILFADIRGFTRMSEQMSPEEVVNMLNIYLSILIERVIENDGIVNKFAGDNIMGVWNAPQAQQKHALLAVKSAWESQQAIIKRQQEDTSLPKVQFGIGINTGNAIAGNMGSSGRCEYTVIGDSVNLASRICSATTGGEVWIGPETYQQVKGYVEVEELGPKSFKGKEESVTVYKVIGVS